MIPGLVRLSVESGTNMGLLTMMWNVVSCNYIYESVGAGEMQTSQHHLFACWHGVLEMLKSPILIVVCEPSQ